MAATLGWLRRNMSDREVVFTRRNSDGSKDMLLVLDISGHQQVFLVEAARPNEVQAISGRLPVDVGMPVAA